MSPKKTDKKREKRTPGKDSITRRIQITLEGEFGNIENDELMELLSEWLETDKDFIQVHRLLPGDSTTDAPPPKPKKKKQTGKKDR